ncbi:ABC transporter domain-containing protein [Bordetella sputigena]
MNPARSQASMEILRVEDLHTEFRGANGVVHAVNGVDLTLRRGEILGLVGESGSGKSVTGYSILGLVDPPGRVTAGRVLFAGIDLRTANAQTIRSIRGRRIAMVFQDPMSTLHPMLRIGTQMTDTLHAHQSLTRRAAWTRAVQALERVGIPSPAERMQAYPHQLSGGMRQRVAIAIALLNDPDIIIADEPTTGLDVTIQAQILAEVQKVVAQSGTALIWITHDLGVVANLADNIAVMYAGGIVEYGGAADVLANPAHPYTRGLLASVPARNRDERRLPQIPGSIASAATAAGCRFQPRCDRATSACAALPAMRPVAPRQTVRCVHPVSGATQTIVAEG